MKRQRASKELLDDISVSDAKGVGRALYNHRLSQRWLQLRLDRDMGIKIHASQLSEVLDGKRALGPKMRLMVWCSKQIMVQYEEYYGDCGRKSDCGSYHDDNCQSNSNRPSNRNRQKERKDKNDST